MAPPRNQGCPVELSLGVGDMGEAAQWKLGPAREGVTPALSFPSGLPIGGA